MILKMLDRASCAQLKELGYDSLKMLSSGTYDNKQFALYTPATPLDRQNAIPIDELKYDSGKKLYVCL